VVRHPLSQLRSYDPLVGWLRKTLKWGSICLGGLVATLAILLLWGYENHRIKPRSGCPLLAWLMPIDHSELLPGDYIEVREFSAGPYSWEPLYVRIYADGRVERDTVVTIRGEMIGCPLHAADRTARIRQEDAQKLLIRARDGGFCRLCDSYRYPAHVYDAGSSEVTLSLHGKSKSVWNSLGKPPQLFGELIDSTLSLSPMDELADPMKFSDQRSAECEEFLEKQNHH
jgi:hypothetical protein